jgi:glc operon protein GlcG
MKTISLLGVCILTAMTALSQTTAQKSPVVAYGEPITLEAAKKLAAASEKFALEKQWTIVVAIVDTGGNLVLLQKMDNTQIA